MKGGGAGSGSRERGEVWRDGVGDGRERNRGRGTGALGEEACCRVLLKSGGFHGDEGRWEGERQEASPNTHSLFHTITRTHTHTHTRTHSHTHKKLTFVLSQ